MKGLYFDGMLILRDDIEKPEAKEGEALIKILMAAVCNTDKEIIKGYKGFKGVLGHEFVGVVEESSDRNLVGKRVVGEINIGCGKCSFCKAGFKNHCEDREVLGMIGKNGSFAEYITLPNQNIHLVPDNVTDLEAVYVEPLAAALEITEKCHVKPSHKVAIVGDGKLAYMIAQIISLTACDLSIIGKHNEKLDTMKNIAKTMLLSKLDYENYFDIVIDSTGNEQGLIIAQKIVKAMGVIILKSTYNIKAKLSPPDWVVKEITIIGTRCGPVDAALRLFERKLISVDSLAIGFYLLEEYEEALNPQNMKKTIFYISKTLDI
ncbi:MAG: alcohol dehydrogenase catalytic domain-containing protein [Clostridiales bacterium]|nr:alcohol dehydrogenase catalytic domain-containing protein [Clostridiales bacterium]